MKTTDTEQFLRDNISRIEKQIGGHREQIAQIAQAIKSLEADHAKITDLLSDEPDNTED